LAQPLGRNETTMTVIPKLKQQHRNILYDVIAACKASLRNHPAPFLLPTISWRVLLHSSTIQVNDCKLDRGIWKCPSPYPNHL
jgi:hypothetical protein